MVAADSTQRPSDPSQLIRILAPKLGGAGGAQEQTVLIRADLDVRYREFMAVVNQLERGGYSHVGLISEELG